MQRLTYLYVRHRNYAIDRFKTDGHYALLGALAEQYNLEVDIVLNNYAKAHHEFRDGRIRFIETPDIDHLVPGGIVWVRGMFKPSWTSWVDYWSQKRWFVMYAANTGRGSWPQWDVVLWDLERINRWDVRTQKLWYYYRKPVSPKFRNLGLEERFDVCVGASHIYDRKGQFRALPLCRRFKELAGRDLRVVIPGAFYGRERQTEAMKKELLAGKWPNIVVPGMLPIDELVQLFNTTRHFYASTCGGQGDRATLEAMACGCRLIIGTQKPHAPYTYDNPFISFTPETIQDTDAIAEYLAGPELAGAYDRRSVSEYYQDQGSTEAALENLRPLMEHLLANPKNPESLKELL